MMTPAMPDIDRIKSSVPELLNDNVLVHDLNGSHRPKSDIRKGIPSLPEIWNKRLSARQERRQAKRNSGTTLLPQPSNVKLAAVDTPAVQQISRQLSQHSAEGKNAQRPVMVGRKPVRQPAELNAERGRKPVPQPAELNAERFEISMPLQLRERLKTWNLSSALQLTADENAIFENSDIERLEQFSHFLHQNGSTLFHGLPSRTLVLTLVAVTGPATAWKCICIKGLTKESEITSFHAVLSQRSVRANYKPWKLCYDKSLVETAASLATYQTNTSEAPQTICGTLLRTNEPGKGTWISTIGGIVEVDGEFFAVTSAHHPNHLDPISDESLLDSASGSFGTSVADTLVEKGLLDTEVEPALIIDTWKEQEHGVELVNAVGAASVLLSKPPKPTNPFFWPDLNTTVREGSDWRLLTVDEEHQLPNCIPFQQSTKGAQMPSTATSPLYLTADPLDLSKRAVYILAGVSGVCPGMLSNNVSFLNLGNDKPQIVWSVKLDREFGKLWKPFSRSYSRGLTELELQKGDSGSWVVDASTNNILGYVVAISTGSSYLIPLTELFEQILQSCNPGTTICVPSAFKVLLKLARYHYAAEPYGEKPLSNYYSSEALSPQVLKPTSSDPTMLLLSSAIGRGEDRSLLARLICTLEKDLWPLLGSFSGWSSEQRRRIDQDLVPLLTRIENSMFRANPELEINVITPSPMVDVEKEREPQGKFAFVDLSKYSPPYNQSWFMFGFLACTDTSPENPTYWMNDREFARTAREVLWALERFIKRQIKSIDLALLSILGYASILGFGVAGGVAATATFAHMEGLPYSRELLGNGALGALVLTAIFHVQYALAAFSSYIILRHYWRKRYCGLKWATPYSLLLLPLQVGLSFARTLFTALILISRFHTRSKLLNLTLDARTC